MPEPTRSRAGFQSVTQSLSCPVARSQSLATADEIPKNEANFFLPGSSGEKKSEGQRGQRGRGGQGEFDGGKVARKVGAG